MCRTWAVVLVLAAVLGGCGKASTSASGATAPRAVRPCGNRSPACRVIVTTQGGTTKRVFVEAGPVEIEQEPPRAVKRAEGSRLAAFEFGRSVMAQSGCLAYHKIGVDGNAGPGQDLAHVGASLTPARIERAIVYPTEPMPSFRHLPKAKLRALVTLVIFLSELR